MKTDKFYGYGIGALSLCAAAVCLYELFTYLAVYDWLFYILKHKQVLKLWWTGNTPMKDMKKTFVCKLWAI
jgi:hypothetical protein